MSDQDNQKPEEQSDPHRLGDLAAVAGAASPNEASPRASTTDLAQLILDTAEEGFCLFSAQDQRVAAFNRQFAEFLGLDPEWLSQHPAAEEVAKAIYDREKHPPGQNLTGYLRRVLNRHQRLGEWNLELNLADGRTIIGRSQAAPSGERLYTAHDVTRYRQVMQELEDERKRWSTMVEHAPVAYYMIECPSGQIVEVSRSIKYLTGYSAESFLASKTAWLQNIMADDRDLVESKRTPAIENCSSFDIQYRRIHTDGSARWFHEMAEVIPKRNANPDQPGRMAGVLIDITRQKVAEANLRESERRFRELIEGIPELIFYEHDPDRRLTYVNPSVKDIIGYAPHEMIGRRFGDRPQRSDHDADLEQAYRFVAEAIRTGRRQPRYEIQVRAKSGDLVMLEIHEYPVTTSTGTVIGFRGVARDITSIRTMERRLRERERLAILGTFAGGLAHDLNNLLLPIRASLETLERQPDRITVQQRATAIKQATDHIGDLVKKLLFWTRQDSSMASRAIVTNVREWADHAINFYRESVKGNDDHASANAINIELDFRSPPTAVAIDPDLLKQAILNLVLNARDAMPAGGTITLTIDQSPDDWMSNRIAEVAMADSIASNDLQSPNPPYASDESAGTSPRIATRFTVTDEGVGMDDSITERAFDPFFSTKARGKSTGLGLALVRAIIQSADGAILIESRRGKGTTIHFDIPAALGESRSPTNRHIQPIGKAIIRVSEPMTAAFLSSALEQMGFTPRLDLHEFPVADDLVWFVATSDTDPRDVQFVLAQLPHLLVIALGECRNPTAWPDSVIWHHGPINSTTLRSSLSNVIHPGKTTAK